MINKEELALISNLFESELDNLEESKNLFEIVNYKMGEIIISPNNLSKTFFILISGQLRIRSLPDEKNKSATLGLEMHLHFLDIYPLDIKKVLSSFQP